MTSVLGHSGRNALSLIPIGSTYGEYCDVQQCKEDECGSRLQLEKKVVSADGESPFLHQFFSVCEISGTNRGWGNAFLKWIGERVVRHRECCSPHSEQSMQTGRVASSGRTKNWNYPFTCSTNSEHHGHLRCEWTKREMRCAGETNRTKNGPYIHVSGRFSIGNRVEWNLERKRLVKNARLSIAAVHSSSNAYFVCVRWT